jgi:hypothetical protein
MNENSRYARTGTAEITLPDGRTVSYLLRRWIPQPETLAEIGRHRVAEGERLDHIAAQHHGDPTLFWQVCDANRALHPAEMEYIGRTLRITLPPGIPAGTTLTF